MAQNIVLVFFKKPPSRFSWVSEIRSMAEGSGRPPQQFVIKLVSKKQGSDKSRGPIIADAILARIPMIRDDIPIAILFRALNICSDKEI
jgi:DNA-directed RNA polymerase II subunit RPB2